jgi:hypothetical protein
MKTSRNDSARSRPLRGGLATLLYALLVVACGDDPVTPDALVAIVVEPSTASIGVGQSRTLSAEGKDSRGRALNGLTFTWTSSDNSVATVSGGVTTGVSAGTTTITASSGGVTSNAVTLTVGLTGGPASSVVIDRASVLLPGSGASAQLTARVLDAQGVATTGRLTWTSSAPDRISVDSMGHLVAHAVGSAQIHAASGTLRSAPTLVIAALPQTGALLVADSQVVSVGAPLENAAGEDTEYEVTLRGVPAPAAGTLIIASETAPVAGRVVGTRQAGANVVATLVIVPLPQLFSDYDISLDLDLSDVPLVEESGSRNLTPGEAWSASRNRPAGSTRRGALVMAPLAFKCTADIAPQLMGTPLQLSIENRLRLIADDQPGYSRRALMGSAEVVATAALKLAAGFKASGTCIASTQLDLPVLGFVSVLVMPAIRLGLGAEVKGEVTLVQGELGVTGRVGISPMVGWECRGSPPQCQAMTSLSPVDSLKTKSSFPADKGMQAKVDAHFFLLAGLDLAFAAGVLDAQIVEARVGPEQAFDLAFAEDQAARRDYASTYGLTLKGTIKPGASLQKAIKKAIGDEATGFSISAELKHDISKSPRGSLSVNKTRVRPDEPVTFTAVLDATTVDYFLIGYNVKHVEIWRKAEDETEFTAWKSMDIIASNRASYVWRPEEADAGKYEFAGFVNTEVPVPLLEIAPNSIQPVEVACFSAASAFRLASVTVHGAGAQGSANPVCVDEWTGTSTVVMQTPGLEGADITVTANITWKYDPSKSTSDITWYYATGSFSVDFRAQLTGCTITSNPSTFAISQDELNPWLYIAGFAGQYRYGFMGSQLISLTTTFSCPGQPDVVTPMPNQMVPLGAGVGPYTLDQVELSGSVDDGGTINTWSFVRP